MGFMDKIREFKEGAMTQFNRFNNKKTMEATMAALAMIVHANGQVKDEEMQTMTQLIMRDDDLKCYDFGEMMSVFNKIHEEFGMNKFVGEGSVMSKLSKITDLEAANMIIGKVCAIAASDGDFDDNEKDAARKICNALKVHPGQFDL